MRPVLKRGLLAVSSLLLLGIVLLALGRVPQEPLRRAVEARLRAALGPGARIGAIRLTPYQLSGEADDVVIQTDSYTLELPRVRFRATPEALDGTRVRLRFLEIDRPRLLVRESRDAAATSPSDIPVIVEQLTVTDMTVEYQPAQGPPLRLTGVGMSGGVGHGPLDFTVARLEWDREPPVRAMATGLLQISPELAIAVIRADLHTARSHAGAWGHLGRVGAIAPHLEFEADVDLAEAAAHARSAHPVSGTLHAEGRADDRDGVMVVAAKASSRAVRVEEWLAETVNAELRWRQTGELEARFDARVLGGTAAGEATLDHSTRSARIRLEGVDAAALQQRLGQEAMATGRVWADVRVQGPHARPLTLEASFRGAGVAQDAVVRASGSARGRVSPEAGTAAVDWNAELAADPRSPAAAVRAMRLRAKGRASSGTRVDVEGTAEGTADLMAAQGPVRSVTSGRFGWHGDRLDAELQADAGDHGTWRASLAGRGTTLERLHLEGTSVLGPWLAGADGPLRVELDATGPADRLSGSGSIVAEAVRWRGRDFGPASAQLTLTRGLVAAELKLPLGIEGRATVTPSPRYDLEAALDLRDTPLDVLATALPQAEGVTGEVSGRVTVRAAGSCARAADPLRCVSATAVLDTLALRRDGTEVAAAEPVRLRVGEGRVFVETMALAAQGVTASLAGDAGLIAPHDLALQLQATLDAARVTLPQGWSIAGSARADVRVAGAAARPSVTGDVHTDAFTIAGPDFAAVSVDRARVVLTGDAAVLEPVGARLASGSLTASGRVPLAAVWPAARRDPATVTGAERATLDLTWSGLDAAQLVSRWRGDVVASLSGSARIEGGLRGLGEITGRARLEPGRFTAGGTAVETDAIEVQAQGGLLRVDGVALRTEGGTLLASGSTELRSGRIEARADGRADLRTLSPFLADTALTGTADVQLRVAGTRDAPSAHGELRVANGTARLRDIPQALTDINLAVDFDGATARLRDTSATLGGGTLTASGTVGLGRGGLGDVDVRLEGRDMALRYPAGLRTRANASLKLAGREGALLLSGTVTAERGLYDRNFQEALLEAVAPPSDSPLLRAVGLDITVLADNPVLVRNDLARLSARARLAVRGSMAQPAPIGQAEILAGGTLELQERQFTVESGTLAYSGTWDPTIALSARTSVTADLAHYDVTVRAEGPLAAPRVSFVSQPALSESQIVSLLVTGRVGQDALASGAWVVGEQAAALLTGRINRGLGGQLRGLGLDQVTIQPELLAREEQPGARFTFGKNIGPRGTLLYSLSLRQPEQRFVQLEARPGRDVTLLGQRRDDGTLTVGAGQRFRLGGAPRASGTELEERGTRVAAVVLEGVLPLPESALRDALRTGAGDRVTAWDLQDDAERLRDRLRREGFIEAEVGAVLDPGTRKAIFRLRPGLAYRWSVAGLPGAPDLDEAFAGAMFEEEAVTRAGVLLLRAASAQGWPEATVETSARTEAGVRSIHFRVATGARRRMGAVRFPGARALGAGTLLQAAGGESQLLREPAAAVDAIRAAYHARHHLGARVGPVERLAVGDRIDLVVPIDEGPAARITRVTFTGTSQPEDRLRQVAALSAGDVFDPDAVLAAEMQLQDLYLTAGHPAVRIRPEVTPVAPDVAVTFHVSEGERVVVGRVELAGVRRTREGLLRRQIRIRPGDPLDPRRLAETERRIADLGVFARVMATTSPGSPTTVTITVEEGDRLRAGYEARYSGDQGPSARVDAEARNLLGAAVTTGVSYRRGRDVREARGFVHLPSLFGRGHTTLSVFELDEDLPYTDDEDILRNQRGIGIQQTQELGGAWRALYGYRFKRSLTTASAILFPTPKHVAGLDLAALRDTRDNPLDARRGRFFAANLELSPKRLGSDFDFVKGHVQLFTARTFRDSWTWAQGYRLGMAHVFGDQPLVSDEGFEAGGANTVRGYESRGAGGPVAGEGRQAVLVLNQELRYRHRTGLGAAVFWDAGRAFARVGDLGFDLRHAAGVGLRWDSPVGPLRLDVGLPIRREADEKRYQLWFSIGQAF